MHESASISGSLSIHLPANSRETSTSRGEGHRVIFDIFDILPPVEEEEEEEESRGENTKGRVKRDKLGGSRQFFSPLTRPLNPNGDEDRSDVSTATKCRRSSMKISPCQVLDLIDSRSECTGNVCEKNHYHALTLEIGSKGFFFFTRENTLSTHNFFRSTEKTMKLLIQPRTRISFPSPFWKISISQRRSRYLLYVCVCARARGGAK